MENFNKVLSFVLGLVVVIVFVIVLSGRLNLRTNIFTGKQKPKVTVTATPSPTPPAERGFFSRLFLRRATPTPTPKRAVAQPTPTPVAITPPQTKGAVGAITEIPATGAPSLLLPLFGSSALLGFYLRRKK